MPDAPRSPANLPATIDRAAADRILARAIELQSSATSDPEGRLTEAQLEALAKEVGLDPVNLRQALAEERTRVMVPDERGLLASLYGVSEVSAQRTVRGTPTQVLKALDDWMQRQESLIPQRYFGERITWEVRQGFVGQIRRAVSGRGYALVRATTVGATAIAVDGDRVVVRLDAQFADYRRLMAQETAGAVGASAVAGGILVAIHFALIAAAAPVAVFVPAAYMMARGSHNRTVAQAQMALEQVLDRLERGEAGRPPSLVGMLAAAVGSVTR